MTVIKGALCLDSTGLAEIKNVAVEGGVITYVGDSLPEGTENAARVIDGRGHILTPGFVNAHTHVPMTLLRGLGGDKPLHEWLNDYILPAEDNLDGEVVKIGTTAAIAEMLRGGVTSFSEMYFFCDSIAEAVIDTGIKANISRSVVSFDDTADPAKDSRIAENVSLYETYHGAAEGRVKVEFSIHAEYTNVESYCRYIADLAKKYDTGIHIHLSETKSEHEEAKSRRSMSAAAFFESCGVFDVPVTAAHCVWLDEADIAMMAERGATAVHNPRSNLKLASGIMNLPLMQKHGLNVALGTDGSASNNKLDLISEMQLAAILHKGNNYDATAVPAGDAFRIATTGGLFSQGRCGGTVSVGAPADLVLLSIDRPGLCVEEDPLATLVYAADRSDVVMTMVDGRILYDHGVYTTIDTERLSADFICARNKLLGK